MLNALRRFPRKNASCLSCACGNRVLTCGNFPLCRSNRAARAFPLSFAQQRLWFLDQWAPGNPFYNMPQALRITGRLHMAALEQSLNAIVRRHEALRITCTTVDGQPFQVISPVLTVPLAMVDLRGLPDDRTGDRSLATDR